jgi:hypothetical protein
MTTLHTRAQFLARIYTKEIFYKPSCPQWVRDKIACSSRRAALKRAAKQAVAEHADVDASGLVRDYRGWQRDGRRTGPGSGRAADWLDVGFHALARTALQVHRETEYRDDVCRTIARTLHARTGGWDGLARDTAALAALPPCTAEPRYWNRGYTEAFDREMSSHAKSPSDRAAPEGVVRWRLWAAWNLSRALAEAEREDRLSALACDPELKISGYLADSVLSYQTGGGRGHDYAGCSGCASYAAHRDHPEDWDLLASRAPVGASGDGWEQVFPHEHERQARLVAAGWHETLRTSDSVYTLRHPVSGEETRP